MPKLTPAQLKFLLIKGLHLLAVLVIVIVLAFHFSAQYPQTEKNTEFKEESIESVSALSAYEQFCQNNNNISCNMEASFEQKSQKPKIILMDTGEIEDDLREQISYLASGSHTMSFEAQDMHQMLDKLYEEELPDDVIETTSADYNTQAQKLRFVPEHKPPYWGKKPKVVIIIDDMGISAKRTADIIALKYPLTAAFLTYGKNLKQQVENAGASGHEIMLHTPMEPFSKVDVAPDVLTTEMSPAEIKANLRVMLEKFPGIKGINNHMGSKLTEDFDRMVAIMEVLKDKDLFFLDSKTSAKSKAEKAAAEAGVAYAHRHVFLDNNNNKTYILGQLAKVEKLAKKNGYAIAIGHPKTETAAALREWLPLLEKKGLEIIPLSQAVHILNPQIAD